MSSHNEGSGRPTFGVPGGSTTRHNTALVERYLTHLDEDRNRRPQTIYRYRLTCNELADWCGKRSILVLGVDDLRGFLARPRDPGRPKARATLAPATRKREVMELRSLWKWLHQYEGLVPSNPSLALVAPTVHNEHPKPCDEAQWRRLWHSPLSDEDRAWLGLSYFAGLRRAEVQGVEDWHFDDARGMLRGFVRKGGSEGVVPYVSCVRLMAQRRPELIGDGEQLLDTLGRVRAVRSTSPLLFSFAPDATSVNRRLRSLLRGAGLSPQAFTPHQLRHSCATNLLDVGVPLLKVSRIMGHSSVVVTQRYCATSEDPLADELDSE